MIEPKVTILLVDDDADFRNLLEKVILRFGMEVVKASDGNEAIEKLSQQSFNLLITDILMPNVEGIELILKIWKDYPTMPVIAMSAGGRLKAEGYLKMAMAFGTKEVLEKPFAMDVFIAAIRRVLGGSVPPELGGG
ncbi:MAG: response regulator [Pedosphaera sp.]|nr:response regulator [Pedosphaera sp.]